MSNINKGMWKGLTLSNRRHRNRKGQVYFTEGHLAICVLMIKPTEGLKGLTMSKEMLVGGSTVNLNRSSKEAPVLLFC